MSCDLIQEPYTVRGLTLPNRVAVAPMTTWAAKPGTGLANDEHLVHYGSIAESGVGLIITETAVVQACGMGTPTNLGLYEDSQIAPLKKIVDYVHGLSPSKIAVQLGHAGRKGLVDDYFSPHPKHLSPDDEFGHQCVSASAIPHSPEMLTPKELTIEEIRQLREDHVSAARRAVEAGFDAIELAHGHGGLPHQFSSPVSNHRTDEYGGSLDNRLRFTLEIVEDIRRVIPDTMPLICRISCVDWVEDGTTIEDSVYFAKELYKRGVDLIHCTSGGISYKQSLDLTYGYQVKFAQKIKELAGVPTIAVGSIKTYEQAREIIQDGSGDLVAIGRAYLVDPYWWRTALVSRGIIPWHPPRQMMGFRKSQRRLEAEKKAALEAAKEGSKEVVTKISSEQPSTN